MEIWKNINGYEGKYQVSNLGRVKSLARYVMVNGSENRYIKERILKPNKTKNGYSACALGYSNTKNIHKLVLETFYPIDTKMDCMHLDNDRSNNKLDNLKWGTRKDNIRQCVRDGRHKGFENGIGEPFRG